MAIKCPKCQTDNPDTQKFCGECATPLHPSKDIAVTETIETPKEELTTGFTFAGRYQIIEELGKGGMGKVYKVLDKEINAKVALKLIKPEIAADKKTIERFRNELKIARDISQKNVCRMYDLNKEEGSYYITMEYVSGEDLKSFIRRAGPLSAGKTIFLAKQVSAGLVEAHRLGVIHRDLKPQNIMIDKEGNARIMDFGIARSIMGKGITGAGAMIGTPEYMSPEQAEVKEVDQRSDIYSLGVILYEMVTGRVPFEGETPLGIAMKHKSEEPPDPRELNARLPEDLSRMILRCLEKDKEKRYQSAGEVHTELTKIEKGIPTTEREVPERKPIISKEITVTLRKPRIVIAILCIAIVMIGIAFLFLRKEKPALPPEAKRLLILPFENLGSPEDEYFAEGIADEIMARLANVGQLSVIARNTAIQYKGTDKAIQEIGKELDVNHILSGTVRWQRSAEGPSRVRVTPRLVRASDTSNIWVTVYDESINDVFQVQSDIAKQVVEALGIALLDTDLQTLEVKQTENLEAYDFYLRGNDYINYRIDSENNLQMSITMFEKAVSLDPRFTHAYAKLSYAHSAMYWYYFDRTDKRATKAKIAAQRALEIDPDLPDVHIALGYYYYWVKLDFDHALEEFFIAQKKQPKKKEVLEGITFIQRRQGKWNQHLINSKKLIELDPRSTLLAYNLGATYAVLRRYSEAERCLNRAISLTPDYALAYYWKVCLYLNWEGTTEKAREVLREASEKYGLINHPYIVYLWILVDMFDGKYQETLERLSKVSAEAFDVIYYFVPKDLLYAQIYGLMNQNKLEHEYYNSARTFLESKIKEHPEDSRIHSSLGIAYAGLGQTQDAIREAEKAVEMLPVSKDAVRGIYRVMDSAHVYVMLGSYEKAIDKIEYLISIPGEISITLLKLDPKWTPLMDHPHFKKILKEGKSSWKY